MSRFTKFAPALILAASLAPFAAYAGASGAVNPAAPGLHFSQGHLAAGDPLSGERQAGFSGTDSNAQLAQAPSGLSQGHLSYGDPLSGQRQNPNTAG